MTHDDRDERFLRMLTVLYAEDDPATRQQAIPYLERRVGRLVVAEDGHQGLEAFTSESPDIVATDIQMPRLDGLSMVAKMRATSAGTPVIVITAFETVEYLERAIEVGIDDFVLKPIVPARLERALHRAAHRVRVERELAEARDREIRALHERERELRDLLDTASVGIAVVDDESGRLLRVSAGLCRLLGYGPEELTGTDWRQAMRSMGHEDATRSMERFSAGEVTSLQVEWNCVRKDGSEVPTLATITRLPPTPSRPGSRSIVVLADVSERVEHEPVVLALKDRTLERVKPSPTTRDTLPPILSQCMGCKNVRDERDRRWQPLSTYLSRYTNTLVSHGICPECAAKMYPDVMG